MILKMFVFDKFKCYNYVTIKLGREANMAIGREIIFDEKAKAVLNKYNLVVSQAIDYSHDRREFFPDMTEYEIVKDNELIFKYRCKGEEREGRRGPDGEFAIEPLRACLKAVESKQYAEQTSEFKSKLKELLELRKDHKFSKFAAKKELKEECEKLCRYYNDIGFTDGKPSVFVNAPLMEDNKELFEKVLKELQELQAEWDKNRAMGNRPEEAVGPISG